LGKALRAPATVPDLPGQALGDQRATTVARLHLRSAGQ
jgi:hypothetical protein